MAIHKVPVMYVQLCNSLHHIYTFSYGKIYNNLYSFVITQNLMHDVCK